MIQSSSSPENLVAAAAVVRGIEKERIITRYFDAMTKYN